MSALEELGITKEDVIERAVDRLLESFGEDGESITQAIKAAVVSTMLKQAGPKIDALLSESLINIVDAEFTPVNEWGEPQRKQPTSLRQLTTEKCLHWLQVKVGSNGEPSTYSPVGTRAEWLAREAAKKAVDYSCQQELTKAVDAAKSEVKRLVAQHITAMLLK